MNIADIFFGAHIDTSTLSTEAIKGGGFAGQAGGTSLGSSLSAAFRKSFSGDELGKGLIQGLGLAGGLGIAKIVGEFVDVIGDAISAAREDQVSIQKLGTSLRDNVKDWDGNTTAIERVIKARQALGFSDEDQRNSLALLVGATHDVTKALTIERTAMDLVRYEATQGKVISLADASEALTKVEAGSYRILKSLGIQLGKNATQQDALNAVQKIANGQAEDYAQTNEGKLLVSQVALGEALEKLGYVIMPAVTSIMVDAANAASFLADSLGIVAGTTPEQSTVDAWDSFLQPFTAKGINNFLDFITPWDGVNNAIREETAKTAEAINNTTGSMSDATYEAVRSVGMAGKAVIEMGSQVRNYSASTYDQWVKTVDGIVTEANKLIDQAFAPIEAHTQLMADNAETAAARRIIASDKSSKAEIAAAKRTLTSTTKDTAEQLLLLASTGNTNSKAYKTGLANLEKYAAGTTGSTKKYLDGVIAKIKEVERVGAVVPVNFVVGYYSDPDYTKHGKAAGGPVLTGVPYLVNENTPRSEWFVPTEPGTIVNPEQAAKAAFGGGGGNTNITIALPGNRSPDPFETARELQRLADFGMLSPRPTA